MGQARLDDTLQKPIKESLLIDGLQRDGNLLAAIRSKDFNHDLIADLVLFQQIKHVFDGLDRLAVDPDNDITEFDTAGHRFACPSEAGSLRSAPTNDLSNDDTFDSPTPGDRIGNERDSQPWTDEFSILDQLR